LTSFRPLADDVLAWCSAVLKPDSKTGAVHVECPTACKHPFCCVADDVLAWLARCSAALRPGGLIVVKENLTTVSRFEIDDDDASVARSDDYLRELFKKAQMKLLYSAVQRGAPSHDSASRQWSGV